MTSTRSRQDLAATAVLATMAFGLYSFRAGQPPAAAEQPLNAAVDLLTARGGHDAAGRFLPLFVQVASDISIPPVPAYASLVVATAHQAYQAGQPPRRAAALFGALGVVLTYVFAAGVFRQRGLGWIAALLLLTTPAYAASARSGALDGVWVIPALLLSLIAVARFVDTGSRRWLALAAAALVACAYAQPSGACLVVIVAAAMLIGLGKVRPLTVRDAWWAAGGAALAALPMALWFLAHPTSYFDTFGRWFLHQAYIRHPWSLVPRLMNYFSLAEWASIYWNFFDPSRLFYRAGAPASAGTLLMPLAPFLGVAVYDVAQTQRLRRAAETALLWIVVVGFIASPLVPTSFSEPGAIGKALSLPLFGAILCTLGMRACWTRPAWTRAVAVLLLGLALAQFVVFYRSLL